MLARAMLRAWRGAVFRGMSSSGSGRFGMKIGSSGLVVDCFGAFWRCQRDTDLKAAVCRQCFLPTEVALHLLGGGLIIHPCHWSSLLRPNTGLTFQGVCGSWADKVLFRTSFNPNHQA